MLPTLTNQTQDPQVPRRSRQAPDSSLLESATRDYLRGQLSLDDYTRLVDNWFEAAERSQNNDRGRKALDDFVVMLAKWLKHSLPRAGQ